MFVAGDFMVDLSFPIAQSRLAAAACQGSLGRASESAYGDGLAELIRSGHAGAARQKKPELAGVRCRELVAHGESAVLTLRWEACLPGGKLFPALDADITLVPAGGEITQFSLAGVYRPPREWPSADPGPGIWRRAAAATIRYFLAGLPAVLATAGAGNGDSARCDVPDDGNWPGGWWHPENLSPVPLVLGDPAGGERIRRS